MTEDNLPVKQEEKDNDEIPLILASQERIQALTYKHKYTPEMPDKALAYLKDQQEKKRIPTLAGFAYSIGVDKLTVLNWVKKYEAFNIAVRTFKASQEDILINDNNTKRMIFLLSNWQGYKDKVDVETYGKDGKPMISFVVEDRSINVTPKAGP